MVGALNPISVAFAVLFVGLGVDFGIQFSVRYRSERHALRRTSTRPSVDALVEWQRRCCSPGPRSQPRSIRSCRRLRRAFRTRPDRRDRHHHRIRDHDYPASGAAHGAQACRASRSRSAMRRWRRWTASWNGNASWIVGPHAGRTFSAAPLLANLRFDFNPLDLRAQDLEAIATYLDLMNDPDSQPEHHRDSDRHLARSPDGRRAAASLPEVGRVLTLQSFVPEDQDAEACADRRCKLLPPEYAQPRSGACAHATPIRGGDRRAVAETLCGSPGLDAPPPCRPAASPACSARLAPAPSAALDRRTALSCRRCCTTLRQVRLLLTAEAVSIESLPALESNWISPDGQARDRGRPRRATVTTTRYLRAFCQRVRRSNPMPPASRFSSSKRPTRW